MSRQQEIETRLRKAFAPTVLEVVDDSESHRGHSGFQEGGESHFNVAIRSEAFKDMNRLGRHRAIHSALGPELIASIHALALDVDV
ncbi:MAG: BolA family protein [Roseobacter sp.]